MYYFFIGSYEKGGFQNENLKDSKYIGRAKTKNKYLALLNILNVSLFGEEQISNKIDKAFYEKYKDNITGDLYFIDDAKVIKTIFNTKEINNKVNKINEIEIYLLNNGEEMKVKSFFRNKTIKEATENSEPVNEYTKEEKIKALEKVFLMNRMKGEVETSEWIEKLNKLKEENDKDM